MMNRQIPTLENTQRGAVLIVALMLLVVLSMLGISAIESTKLQTRMAANTAEYNYAFQVGEIGIEIPRGYSDEEITPIMQSNTPRNEVRALTRRTLDGNTLNARVEFVTNRINSPALQDLSGSAECGMNSGCRIIYFVTHSVGQSNSRNDNAPSVSLYGGLRKKVLDEAASGTFRE